MSASRRLPSSTATVTSGGTRLRFYHADALKLLERIPANAIDVVVTSPPYNLGVRYRSYDDALPGASYLGWTGDWVAAVRARSATRARSS